MSVGDLSDWLAAHSPHFRRRSRLLKGEVLFRADASGHRNFVSIDRDSWNTRVRARGRRHCPVRELFYWRVGEDLRLR